MSSHTSLILAGGTLHPSPQLHKILANHPNPYVIAADSGLRHAKALGLVPDMLVGDFDSVAAEDLAAFATVPRQDHPAEKDFLDLELAVAIAQERGAERVLLLGATGARLDQSLTALLLALRLRSEGLQVSLHSGWQDVYPLRAGDMHRLQEAKGTVFSLLSMDVHQPAVVTVTGTKYTITHTELAFGVGHGVSNVVVDKAEVQLEQGLALLIIEHYPEHYPEASNS